MVLGEQNSKQYLVKYKGLAHAHNQWISETQMLQEAPSLLSKFNRNYQKNMVGLFMYHAFHSLVCILLRFVD